MDKIRKDELSAKVDRGDQLTPDETRELIDSKLVAEPKK